MSKQIFYYKRVLNIPIALLTYIIGKMSLQRSLVSEYGKIQVFPNFPIFHNS